MPESLGETLKKVRESKKFSLEEVSEKTRIPKKIISAIEEDRLSEIPSDFYKRHFIKTYAKFLDALGQKAIREYLSLDVQKKEAPILALKPKRAGENWFIKHKRYIAVSIISIFSIWLFLFTFVQMKKFLSHKRISIPSQYPEKGETEKKEDINLEIAALSNTWIEVIGDGQLLFRGILRKKQKDVWQAEKKIELEVGNAGGVALRLNEKKLGPLGKKGEKKKVIITKDGIE